MNKKKLLILCHTQWGYHIYTYKYATYLKDDYDITYLCWDYENKRIEEEGVKVKYISRNGSLLFRNLRYLYSAKNEIDKISPDIFFIKYLQGCSLLKLINPKKIFIFDIRTASIKKNKIRRIIYDSVMLLESKFFYNITIISESLANKIKIKKGYHVLPIGSDILSKKNKKINELKLIYIGTLDGRDIIKTIEGFSIYLKKYKPKDNIVYTLVGDGKDIKKLQEYVRVKGLEKNIHIIGRVPFNKLEPLMDSHNIGVSFVPCTEYFDCQPVTKTFDYLLSGMPVIATNTLENKKVINSINGVLIADNSESFANGIYNIHENMNKYDSIKIRSDAKKYDWNYVINDLKKYINNL